jgi:hypothetical protein
MPSTFRNLAYSFIRVRDSGSMTHFKLQFILSALVSIIAQGYMFSYGWIDEDVDRLFRLLLLKVVFLFLLPLDFLLNHSTTMRNMCLK